MGFQALFKREDVLTILQGTLSDYFRERLGKDIYVGYEKRQNCMEFIMVPKLGMIMKPYPSKEIRTHYYDAYNIRGNLIKNIAAKVLIFIATHTKNILSLREHLYVENNQYINDKTIFSVCNRSIRMFDYENGYTVSIQKQSFTDKFFVNQLSFRKQHQYDFVPPMNEWGETWFSENILSGRMLARETNVEQYKLAEQKSLASMFEIGRDTVRYKKVSDYVRFLLNKSLDLLGQARENKEITTYAFANKYLHQIFEMLESFECNIPLVLTHGDLQGGNVLIDHSKVWIIDWETNDIRSAWFDEFTVKYGTRYYGGIQKLVAESLSGSLICHAKEVFPCELEAKYMVAIFLLEDIIFYLEDMLELPGQAGKDTFDRYLSELSEINWTEFSA